VVGELVAAAAGTLDGSEYCRNPIERGRWVRLVPGAPRRESQYVHEVIVDKDRDRRRIRRLRPASTDEKLEDIHDDGIGRDAVGFTVPVLEDCKDLPPW